MANAKQLTIPQLKSAINTYVANNKIAQEWNATYNIVGLLDTIGKIQTIDQVMSDKLAKFDGEYLSYGKTVEDAVEKAAGYDTIDEYFDSIEKIKEEADSKIQSIQTDYDLLKATLDLNHLEDDINNEDDTYSTDTIIYFGDSGFNENNIIITLEAMSKNQRDSIIKKLKTQQERISNWFSTTIKTLYNCKKNVPFL